MVFIPCIISFLVWLGGFGSKVSKETSMSERRVWAKVGWYLLGSFNCGVSTFPGALCGISWSSATRQYIFQSVIRF